MTVSPSSTWPTAVDAPEYSNIFSVIVVFPASTWANIPTLRREDRREYDEVGDDGEVASMGDVVEYGR